MRQRVRSRGDRRGLASRTSAEKKEEQRGGGPLGFQPREGGHDRGRRTSCPSSSRGRPSAGRGEERRWKGERRKEVSTERKEEEEKGSKEEVRLRPGKQRGVSGAGSPEWVSAQSRREEGSTGPLSRDRPGPPREGSQACGAESPPPHEKEGCQGPQHRVRGDHRERERGRRGHGGRVSLSNRFQDPRGSQWVPRRPGSPSPGTDERCAAVGNRKRRQTWDAEGLRGGLLQAVPPAQKFGTLPAGAPDDSVGSGLDGLRSRGGSRRPSSTALQELRIQSPRNSLVSCSTPGDPGPGGRYADSGGGDGGSSQGRLPGEQDAMAGKPPRWSRKQQPGQRHHKGKEQEGRGWKKRLWKGSKRRKGWQLSQGRPYPPGEGRGSCPQGLRRKGEEEKLEKSRDETLVEVMKEVEKLMKTGYEGGTAVAPRLTRGTVGLPGGSSFEEMPPVVQSVHAASTKIVAEEFKHSVPESSSMDEQLGSLALEPTAEAFVSGKKKDARVCLEGLSLSAGGSRIVQGLLEVLPLRSQTTGKGEKLALFPLPTSRSFLLAHFPELSLVEVDWLICVCLSLNSTWGGMIENEKEINKVQEVCLNGLIKDVKRFCSLDTRIEELDWRDFFNTRSVDYKGDEVKVARKFSWSNIAPALPREVGKVPLVALCTLGSKYYVEHFDSFLKPVSQWGECRRPRVMVDDHHWGEVCTGLVDSGVCTFIEESEVFHVHGEPLLNGLFGVTKDEWTDSGVEIFRLIMNLVPLNSLCMPMTGDVETLPSWGGMSPFFLQPTQNLVITSEDVKCFFYTMSVPPAWVKYFAFNKPVPEHVLPRHLRGNRVYLASLVLPMGFLNSVSLAQHVHRNLVMASGVAPLVSTPLKRSCAKTGLLHPRIPPGGFIWITMTFWRKLKPLA